MMFLIVSTRVDSRAMNQHVAPFLAISLVSRFISPNLERMDKLSNSQYSRKKMRVRALR